MIKTRQEYDFIKGNGFEPLYDKRFRMDIGLRKEIQAELFGRGHTPAENNRFYRWVWKRFPHMCCECLRPLQEYSATYISHVISRGSEPQMAHDPRNVMILCAEHHAQYEHRPTRENMRIYPASERVIAALRADYSFVK